MEKEVLGSRLKRIDFIKSKESDISISFLNQIFIYDDDFAPSWIEIHAYHVVVILGTTVLKSTVAFS